MKFYLLIFVYVFCINVQAVEKVEFVANRVHSLLVFVNTISGSPYSAVAIKELFESSKYNNDESKKKIAVYQDLDNAFGRYFEFGNMPRERKSKTSVMTMLWIQSAFSKDLVDFQRRMLGSLRLEEISRLQDVLSYFEPIHDELLWKPHRKALETYVKTYSNNSKKWKLNELFIKAHTFYNANWPDKQTFRVSFFPIPPKSRQSSASSYGSFESVGIIIGEKDHVDQFGVIFHELCHSLYDSQSTDFQNQLSKWYSENKSPYSKMAYSWINETLATILGNGWVFQRITGKLNKGEWYSQPIIDAYSKALYPEVAKYLSANKTIDQEFVEASIEVFQKTFPDSIRDLGSLLSNITLVTDGSMGSTRVFSQQLRGIYRVSSINSSSPINNEDTIKTIRENQSSTVVILSRSSNIGQFELLKSEMPFFGPSLDKAPKVKNLIGLFDREGKKFLITVVSDDLGYEYIVQKLKALKKFDRLNEFIDLDTIE